MPGSHRTPSPHCLAEGPGNTAANTGLLPEARVGTKGHGGGSLAGSGGGARGS